MKEELSNTIPVVEDELTLVDLVKESLELAGFDVLTATDGVETVKMYADHREDIALVLSDMGLPKPGGWKAFMKMKEVNPEIKAILASGYFDVDLRSDVLEDGAVDFIEKPYVVNNVLQTIRQALG